MSRPRENPRIILKKFPPTKFVTLLKPEKRFFKNYGGGKIFENIS